MNRLSALLGIAATLFASAANSQTVSLKSRDGVVQVEGKLLNFDGEFYRIDTAYGELTIDGAGVICTGEGCPSSDDYVSDFTLSGSGAVGEILVPALIESFGRSKGFGVRRVVQDDTRFEYVFTETDQDKEIAKIGLRIGSASTGFADLLTDEADLALSVREVTDLEAKRAIDAGLGDLRSVGRSRIVALDALVPAIAPDNSVQQLTIPQLADIFSGRTDNWNAFGGPDAPIALHGLSEDSGLQSEFERRVLARNGRSISSGLIRHATTAELVDAVARDAFAIGIGRRSEMGSTERVNLVDSCGYPALPLRGAVKAEDYPLTLPLFLYQPKRRLPVMAREFLLYLRSPSAQVVMQRAGFADQIPDAIRISAQGQRFANAISQAGGDVTLDELKRLVASVGGMRRLTTTYRFRSGSTRLDITSQANIEELARAIELGRYDDRTLLFAGFSDAEGSAKDNLRLSGERAQIIADAVISAATTADLGRIEVQVDGFGETLPMACDDTDWGRQINRRVEVWVR